MRNEIASVVFPVLRKGLVLRRRLKSRHASNLDWQKEQKELQGLLQATPKSREAILDYLGDNPQIDVARSYVGSNRFEAYAGIRYALTCWIDEIMIQRDLPWNEIWSENSLEWALFQSRERGEQFWKQAARAQRRPLRDPLEVFYLCVMLGFRGEWVDHPEKVHAWRDQIEAQITEEHAWTPPPERKVKPYVPPLVGARRKQRMALLATVTALLMVLVGFFIVVFWFR